MNIEDKSPADLKRTLRCRDIIKRSREQILQRLEEGSMPRSRRKRLDREDVDNEDLANNGIFLLLRVQKTIPQGIHL